MEKKNTLLRYAGIRDDGYRDYLEVVLLGNMTDALTERMRKAIAASGFDFDPMELHLPSWPDKPTVYEIVSFSATADSADGDISCEDFVSSFEKPCTSKEGEKSETAEDDEYIDSGTRAYKLKQLRMMLSQETAVGKTHYGAKLSTGTAMSRPSTSLPVRCAHSSRITSLCPRLKREHHVFQQRAG